MHYFFFAFKAIPKLTFLILDTFFYSVHEFTHTCFTPIAVYYGDFLSAKGVSKSIF